MKENQHIEWKESWRDEYLKWICGFANAEGGVMVIGRNDNGKVSGVPDAEKLLVDLPNKVRDVLGIMVDVNLRGRAPREYVEIVVPPYPNAISYRGEYFYRSGSTNQMLKGAALERLLLRKHGRSWDGVPHPGIALKDLDKKALAYFRAQALRSGRLSAEIIKESDGALLGKLHLREGKYLTRAAALLFHPLPERFIGGAYLKIGFFETNTELRYQDVISGDLFTQVNQAIDVIRLKYMKALISYEGLQRIETYPVPEAALREAMLNAVVHKDYASSIPIQISVYADKLMIWNPGQLPTAWTLEHLLGKHSSEPFNPNIANAFFRAGMIESWGRGIERILEACGAANAPAPEFHAESAGVWTVFTYADGAQDTTQETAQETTQEKILTALRGEPTLTRKALAERIGLSADGVKYHLGKLKSEGRIRHVGPTKAGKWEVLK